MDTRLLWAIFALIVVILLIALAGCGPGFVHFDFTVCSPGAEMQTTTTQANGTKTVSASQAPPPCPVKAFIP